MRRIVMMEVCLMLALSVSAWAQGEAPARPTVQIATTVLELVDTNILGSVYAGEEMPVPPIAIFPTLTSEELTSLIRAGIVTNEPRFPTVEGVPSMPITMGRNMIVDGEDVTLVTTIRYVVQASSDGGINVQFGMTTRRTDEETEARPISIMFRTRNGETTALAAISDDGWILNPVFLVTARVLP